MEIKITNTPQELGEAAGRAAAKLIRQTLAEKGRAHLILATGTSQFETLNQLVAEPHIDWGQVVLFHLDEYIGLPESAPASFRKYLRERFIAQVPPLKAAHLVNGEADPTAECARLAALIQQHPIDVALIGIGENGHIAFNDPPADFATEQPYIVVALDELCRRQQFGEGWFHSMEEVPRHAISMSVKQIMKSKHLICSVPDRRKAEAVKNSLEQPISNHYPATILQTHPDCTYFLDQASAALLAPEVVAKWHSNV